jgi:hypothetical protein
VRKKLTSKWPLQKKIYPWIPWEMGTTALSEFQPSKAQTVCLKLLTAETFIQFRTIPCEIYGGLGTGFSSSTSVFPVGIVSPLQSS